ncbi:MAG: antibiotic biosynthesis monooxygenase family protein [Balneolales bacterium]
MVQTEQNKYGLSGKFTANDGKADELASILLKASKLVSTAKGCQLYIISKDPQNENHVWVTEVWDSKADHNHSLHVEGVRELISKAIP